MVSDTAGTFCLNPCTSINLLTVRLSAIPVLFVSVPCIKLSGYTATSNWPSFSLLSNAFEVFVAGRDGKENRNGEVFDDSKVVQYDCLSRTIVTKVAFSNLDGMFIADKSHVLS